jgi:hypothetical protein
MCQVWISVEPAQDFPTAHAGHAAAENLNKANNVVALKGRNLDDPRAKSSLLGPDTLVPGISMRARRSTVSRYADSPHSTGSATLILNSVERR